MHVALPTIPTNNSTATTHQIRPNYIHFESNTAVVLAILINSRIVACLLLLSCAALQQPKFLWIRII
jgi:hypothetical protein